MWRLVLTLSLVGCIESTRPQREVDLGTGDTTSPPVDTTPEVASDTPSDVGEPCEDQGTTRCLGLEATQICNAGRWQTVACTSGRVCVDLGGAQCLDATGKAVCRDVLTCFAACHLTHREADARDACLVACFIDGSEEAQSEVSLFTSCLDVAGCDTSQDGLLCVEESCSQALALCYFDKTGDKSCARAATCVGECGDDRDCQIKCGEDATLAAQGELAVLDLCLQYACLGSAEANCTRDAMAVGGVCARQAVRCLTGG